MRPNTDRITTKQASAVVAMVPAILVLFARLEGRARRAGTIRPRWMPSRAPSWSHAYPPPLSGCDVGGALGRFDDRVAYVYTWCALAGVGGSSVAVVFQAAGTVSAVSPGGRLLSFRSVAAPPPSETSCGNASSSVIACISGRTWHGCAAEDTAPGSAPVGARHRCGDTDASVIPLGFVRELRRRTALVAVACVADKHNGLPQPFGGLRLASRRSEATLSGRTARLGGVSRRGPGVRAGCQGCVTRDMQISGTCWRRPACMLGPRR
ncbi:hypothetical protein PHLGIDRAFT_406826 [Phlebiopsis gigantea 11061_1 CR5-6]|uniref:Uncharacterized protein n=1 Tax=Phlebiopsis gigantea (strain 11061_1 CR5-6) TaxID=745531 RepID=A0A0C3PMH1_PHLG1|nr:hypothetical protein PHLGIDRAFT_406826 [Phlebiopsis gigantea 11061_1 CR5-6]